MTYKELIENILDKHQIKAEELSNILGITPLTLYRWRKGLMKPSDQNMVFLEYLYQISSEDLNDIIIEQQETIIKLRKSKNKNLAKSLLTSGIIANGVLIMTIIKNIFDND